MQDPTVTASTPEWEAILNEQIPLGHALSIVWSVEEMDRTGEMAFINERVGEGILGRGASGEGGRRLTFTQARPAQSQPMPPLSNRRISRNQLLFKIEKDNVSVVNQGRCPMLVNGQMTERAWLRAGDTVELQNQLLLVYLHRPVIFLSNGFDASFSFGGSDPYGMVGESEALWELRGKLDFAAQHRAHVMLIGESGTGKELAARTIHARSTPGAPFISRNAATLPPGLAEAELFGNVANYPNPGMPARPGLIGGASGGTLFLDEIGELPEALQSKLLRVMDRNGEYHRLGETAPRQVDLRVIGATNRPLEVMRDDLVARFRAPILLPGLDERPEDIPLLLNALAKRAARTSPAVQAFLDEQQRLRITPKLLVWLIHHAWTTHVRELDQLLWIAIETSSGRYLELTDALKERLTAPPVMHLTETEAIDPQNLPADLIRTCLERNGGNVSRTYRDLGLSSRFVLYRLMKKHGLKVER